MLAFNQNINVYSDKINKNISAVSYTHLDVYKRQETHSAKLKEYWIKSHEFKHSPVLEIGANNLHIISYIITYLLFTAITSVSYNRNECIPEERLPSDHRKVSSILSVSYTHLDVYKRQVVHV